MYFLPCHPRDLVVLRGPVAFTVPSGKVFVLVALGQEFQSGTAPGGTVGPLSALLANGVQVLRAGHLGYSSDPDEAAQLEYSRTTTWAVVPPGISFPAGTVLRVQHIINEYPDQPFSLGRGCGYLMNA